MAETNGEDMKLRNGWLAAPAVVVAVVGLVGTGIGALLQGYWNAQLERTKFEAALIQKALSTSSKKEAAQSLQFLVTSGLLKGLNEGNIARVAKQGDGGELPIFLGAAIRDRMITIQSAKGALTELKYLDGPITDEADIKFRIALMMFQRDKKLDIDGLIGPKTVLALWESCQCPGLLQISSQMAQ